MRMALDGIGSLADGISRASISMARTAAEQVASLTETVIRSARKLVDVSDVIDEISDAVWRTGTFFRGLPDSIPWIHERWKTIGRHRGSLVRGARSSASIIRSVPSVTISRVGKAVSSIVRVRGATSIERKDKPTGGIERE
jgi:hypothetical protein